MRLLLDTHAWLWMISDPDRLSSDTVTILEDRANDLYLSVAAIWEIGIKHAAGRLRYSGKPAVQVPLHVQRSGVIVLPIAMEHALAAAALPNHHRDPFDRLMVAQARSEELTILSADRQLAAYEVELLQP